MSIIFDALNKVQNKTKVNIPNNAPIKKLAPKKNKKLFMTIFTLSILLGILIISITYQSPLKDIPKKETPEIVTNDRQIESRLEENKNTYDTRNDQANEEFYLSGIFFTDNHAMAIINDDIVAIGDLVGGAKVTEIEDDAVELEREGEKFILGMR